MPINFGLIWIIYHYNNLASFIYFLKFLLACIDIFVAKTKGLSTLILTVCVFVTKTKGLLMFSLTPFMMIILMLRA